MFFQISGDLKFVDLLLGLQFGLNVVIFYVNGTVETEQPYDHKKK